MQNILILFSDTKNQSNFFEYTFEVEKIFMSKNIVLFMNVVFKDIISHLKASKVCNYIIVPMEDFYTDNKFWDAKKYMKDNAGNEFLDYLQALPNKLTLENADKTFIENYKHLMCFNTDEILDKISTIGFENLSLLEKEFLKNATN